MFERLLDAEDRELTGSNLKQSDFEVEILPSTGTKYPNPLIRSKKSWKTDGIFVPEAARILANPLCKKFTETLAMPNMPFTMRLAGPRADLHFDPAKTVIGIVTCGGLCPGLNDVIRGLVGCALDAYHVDKIIGFRYGFWGLAKAGRHTALDLTYEMVQRIHRVGGSFLGTSRGPQDFGEMVDTLVHFKVNVLFTIGGDGTQKGATGIAEEARRRGLNIAVMGIPKTIDNDISFSHRTFGFETAVEQAVHAIRCAHSEAISHQYGVGLVKLMGRHSGFIAAQAVLASSNAHICLIPECPISEETFFKLLEKRFEKAQHCVVVVAEGFGQNWATSAAGGKDASGNAKLIDIGALLAKKIDTYMKARPEKYSISTVKYIDPSYIIRACPADASDAAFCTQLATLALHEAMHGVTNAMILSWHDHFTVLPIKLATSIRKVVDLRGRLWRAVREITVDLDDKTIEEKRRVLQRHITRLDREKGQLVQALAKL